MKTSKPRSFVIRTWREDTGVRRWRATVTDLETRNSKGFSRFEALVQHLQVVLEEEPVSPLEQSELERSEREQP